MMSEKQFKESQKECASMLGMSLSEYEKYCKNLKVLNEDKDVNINNTNAETLELLNSLGMDESLLRKSSC